MVLMGKGVRFGVTVLCIETGIVALGMTTMPRTWDWMKSFVAPFLFSGFAIGYFVKEGVSSVHGSKPEWLGWVPLVVGLVVNTAFLALFLAFVTYMYKKVRPVFRSKDLR